MTKERLQELIGENLSNDGKTLDLSGNQIASLEGVSFPASLRKLDLYGNQIASLEGVSFPASLQTLYLSGNRITIEQVDELRKSIKGRVIA